MTDQVILFAIGGINMIIAIFGLYKFSRRGRRMVNFIGDTWSRVLYIVIGIVCIFLGLVL